MAMFDRTPSAVDVTIGGEPYEARITSTSSGSCGA
jgi:hypothetical protein